MHYVPRWKWIRQNVTVEMIKKPFIVAFVWIPGHYLNKSNFK